MTIGLVFRFDGLAVAMLALVVGVGILVAWHVRASLPPAQQRRVLPLVGVFAVAMGVLVTADDLLLLFTAWEVTSVLSFLLVGTKDTYAYARAAARRALAVTGGGGLALLAGLVLLRQVTGATTLSELAAMTPSGGAATAAALLVLAGAATKAAQVPFQGWLPGAMAAPAPVSAYLHSATMVKAGIYLAARLSPTFREVPAWDATLVAVAGASVLYGGWRAVRCTDLKALFAWSTVSQLGFLMLAVSSDDEKVVLGGMALLLAHAAAKGALFLSVGSIEARTGTRELGALRGFGRAAPVQAGVVTVALASLAGVFPFLGFVAKEGALLGMLEHDEPLRAGLFVLGSVLTATYGTRVVLAMWAERDDDATPVEAATAGLLVPPLVMVAATVVMGVVWTLGDAAAEAMRDAVLVPAGLVSDKPKALKLIPGLNLALALSLVSVAVGAVAGWRLGTPAVPSGEAPADRWDRVVDASLDAPATLGERVVAMVRPDDRVVVVGLLLAAAGLLAAPPLLASGSPGEVWESPTELAAMTALVAGVAATVLLRHRFAAVLSLGTVGFAMVAWFAARQAPDLALTQGLVETVVVIAFLVVLRELPVNRASSTEGNARFAPALRAGVAVVVAAAGVGLALALAAHPGGSEVASEILTRALPEGEGRNVVNVVLTDIRSLDTLAEITVVAVAGLGAARLFGRGRRDEDQVVPTPDAEDVAGDGPTRRAEQGVTA